MIIENLIYNQTINQEQKEVINAVNTIQYLSCHAGPGTGKTTTLIEILLQKIEINPLILGTTNSTVNVIKYKLSQFVNKHKLHHLFKKEIIDEKGRTKKLNFKSFLTNNIMTFHSLANKITNPTKDEKQKYIYIENHNFNMILKYIFKHHPKLKIFFETRNISKIEIIRVLNIIIRLTYLKSDYDISLLISPITKDDVKLTNAYHHLFSLIQDLKNNLDFKYFFDLLQGAIKENKSNDIEKTNYFEKNNIGMIICDEYQDMESYCKSFFVSILKKNFGLSVVLFGDKNQAIYRFADSEFDKKIDLEKMFDFQELLLLKNHRSTKNVILASREILDDDKYHQITTKDENGNVELFIFENFYQQLAWLQRYFHDYKQNPKNLENPNCFKNFTILVRSNSDAQQVFKVLRMVDIPCTKAVYTRNNEIVIATIHKYKGRENKHIIGVGCDVDKTDVDEILTLHVLESRAQETFILLGLNSNKNPNSFYREHRRRLAFKKIIAPNFSDEILQDNPVEDLQEVIFQNKDILNSKNIHETKNLNTYKYASLIKKMRDNICASYSLLQTQMLDPNKTNETKKRLITYYRKERENYKKNRISTTVQFNGITLRFKKGRSHGLTEMDRKFANFANSRNLKHNHNDLLKLETLNYMDVDPLFNPQNEEFKLDLKTFLKTIQRKILSKRCCHKYCLAFYESQPKTFLENQQETTQEYKHNYLYCYENNKHKERMKAEIGNSFTPNEQTDMHTALYHYKKNEMHFKADIMHVIFGRRCNLSEMPKNITSKKEIRKYIVETSKEQYLKIKEIEKATEKAYKYTEKDYLREKQEIENHDMEQASIQIENEKLQIEILVLREIINNCKIPQKEKERKKVQKELQEKLKAVKTIGFMGASEAFKAHETLIKELKTCQNWEYVKRYYRYLEINEKTVSHPSFALFIEKELTYLINIHEPLDEKMLKNALYVYENFFRNKPSFDEKYNDTTKEQSWNDFLTKKTPFQTPLIKGFYLVYNSYLKPLCISIRETESYKMHIYRTPKAIQQEKKYERFTFWYETQDERDHQRGKIKRHIENAFENAKNKIFYNFHNECVATFMTFTLPYDKTKKKQITQDAFIVGYCIKIFESILKRIFKEFEKIIHLYNKIFVVGLSNEKSHEKWLKRYNELVNNGLYLKLLPNATKKDLFKSIEYYKSLYYENDIKTIEKPKMAFVKEFTNHNVIHLHGLGSFNVLKMFGFVREYLFNKYTLDSQFIGCGSLASNFESFSEKNTCVPNISFLWAYSWEQTKKDLKKEKESKPLNPLAQHIAVLDINKQIKMTVNEEKKYEKANFSELEITKLDNTHFNQQVNLMIAYSTKYMVKGQERTKDHALSNPQWKNQQLFIYINCKPYKKEKMITNILSDSLFIAKKRGFNAMKASGTNPTEWETSKPVLGGDQILSGPLTSILKPRRRMISEKHPLAIQTSNRIDPRKHAGLLITDLEFSKQDYGLVLEQDQNITKDNESFMSIGSFNEMKKNKLKQIYRTFKALQKINSVVPCFHPHSAIYGHLRYFFVDDLIRDLI